MNLAFLNMSLLQEKKTFSLKEHFEEFTNQNNLSKDEIESIIAIKDNSPKSFTELFSNINSSSFPIKHITDEIELFTPNIYNNINKL